VLLVGGELIMRKALSLLAILLVAALAYTQQNENQSATQGSISRPPAQQHSTITGCLTSGKHGDYKLVDQKGHTNIVYSPAVHLDSYVGQSVTLVGDRDTSQGTDTGTGRATPHFKVYEVQAASGSCK